MLTSLLLLDVCLWLVVGQVAFRYRGVIGAQGVQPNMLAHVNQRTKQLTDAVFG